MPDAPDRIWIGKHGEASLDGSACLPLLESDTQYVRADLVVWPDRLRDEHRAAVRKVAEYGEEIDRLRAALTEIVETFGNPAAKRYPDEIARAALHPTTAAPEPAATSAWRCRVDPHQPWWTTTDPDEANAVRTDGGDVQPITTTDAQEG